MDATPNSESQKVTEYIDSLDAQTKAVVEFLRELFLNVDPEIAEHIKWNSPSFYYSGQMEAFDAKEYKRDIAVINIHRGKILIVFPTGAKINDEARLKGKNYPDGRKIITIENLEDAKAQSAALQNGIRDWLSQVEK
ncbi:MAG: DUF1801 domain-containing protein [Flavobacterium sp.]|uniref:DUF1801 domain-containing protein n=1 Tax=Flavobacterium sp. TaxID=239 RepID=UPI0011F4CF27|nr:DUF1801 domain-containing protein [Flavobacterium sp.]RZJ66099.1 MAG: DUF1801 domain-containing protein [Flavobacterium sp.]